MQARWSFVCLLVLLAAFLLVETPARADTVSDLQSKINTQNQKIADLEKEIAAFQTQLDQVGKQKQTLQQTIQTLDLSRKKITSNIQLTQNKISATDLAIQELGLNIFDKEKRIDSSSSAVERALREVNSEEETSFVERLLSQRNFAEAWQAVDSLNEFQMALGDHVSDLQTVRTELQDTKTQTEKRKQELVNLRKDLAGQQAALDSARAEQSKLLSTTKSQEATYQKLLKDKQAARAAFEKELNDYEAQLKIAIDPSSLPRSGTGVLSWPLDAVRITQYFGNTAFATQNPQIYNGGGHNGIDLAASIGTRVKTALSGVVSGTGNTDLQKGCYSYGKWVLIKHANGLSTLYAHLSVISVSEGQSVSTGDVIGYVGLTGYTTGPHLHFTVYSTQGVKVMKLGEYRTSTTPCGKAELPVAPLNAYLNPLSYL